MTQVAKTRVLMVVFPTWTARDTCGAIVTLERSIEPLQAIASRMTLFLIFRLWSKNVCEASEPRSGCGGISALEMRSDRSSDAPSNLVRHKRLYPLILRSLRQQASRRTRPGNRYRGLMVRDGAGAPPHHEDYWRSKVNTECVMNRVMPAAVRRAPPAAPFVAGTGSADTASRSRPAPGRGR